MTLTHQSLGTTIDRESRAMTNGRFGLDFERAAVLSEAQRAEESGNNTLATELAWERGIIDLILTQACGEGLFRFADRAAYEPFYKMSEHTRDYALQRANETANVELRCHHLAYARAAGAQAGRGWYTLTRALAEAVVQLCDLALAAIPVGDSGVAAVRLSEFVPLAVKLHSNRSVFSDAEQKRMCSWLVSIAEALRDHPWKIDEPNREHRWPFEIVAHLTAFPAEVIALDLRRRSLRLVSEAYHAFAAEPLADTFAIKTAEVEAALRNHFGEPDALRTAQQRTVDAHEHKALLFADAGSGLAAAASYHDAAKAAQLLPAESGRPANDFIARTRSSIEKAIRSGEFKRLSVSTDLKELNFAGADAQQTAVNLFHASHAWLSAASEEDLQSAPLGAALIDLIPVLRTDAEKVVADAATTEQIAAYNAVQSHALLGALVGDAVHFGLEQAVEKQGLTVEILLSAEFLNALSDDQRKIFRVAVERFFARDAVSSAHILSPLVEGLVRSVLRSGGRETARLKPGQAGSAFADDVTLGALLRPQDEQEVAEVKSILGSMFTHLMFAVLASRSGPNVRNRISHGSARFGELSMRTCGMLIAILAALCVVATPSDMNDNEDARKIQ